MEGGLRVRTVMIEPSDQPALEFPLECHIKVIAEDHEGMGDALQTALAGTGVTAPIEAGRASSGGRFKTYNLSLCVDSREMMTAIDQALRSVDGVKFVL